MAPWWTDPTAEGEQAARPAGPATVKVNCLPAALPCRRQRPRQTTIPKSKPFQEPGFWVEVDDSAAPVQGPNEPSKPLDEPPFQFTAAVAPRQRRPLRTAIRILVPSLISVSCAGLIVALTVQAMRPVLPKPAMQSGVQLAAVTLHAALAPPVEMPPPALTPPVIAVVAEATPAPTPVVVQHTPEAGKLPPVAVASAPPPEDKPAPAPVVVVQAEPGRAPAADCAVCKESGAQSKQQTFGTSIHFAENIKAAAEAAKDQKKLMLVLNISGNFEDSGFT